MTAITLTDDGDATLYTARVLHANPGYAHRRANMGSGPGWSAAIAQLQELAQRLPAERA